jgi:hypothetical protein
MGYSLKANVRKKVWKNHPQRNEQFEYINQIKHNFLRKGQPVISIDTKKKEWVGLFKNAGQTWCRKPTAVWDHDFIQYSHGKLIPFGIYDLAKNQGMIYCGTSHETSFFLVEALCEWWREKGQGIYPHATELLILCDSGGANGYRRRLWKWALQHLLVAQTGLTITVCHYPPGTSKWNPIEHRLFSYISQNWAGEPLSSYERALELIRTTRTTKGLKVGAKLINKDYALKIKVTKEEMNGLKIKPHSICPKWNYTLKPYQTKKLSRFVR